MLRNILYLIELLLFGILVYALTGVLLNVTRLLQGCD